MKTVRETVLENIDVWASDVVESAIQLRANLALLELLDEAEWCECDEDCCDDDDCCCDEEEDDDVYELYEVDEDEEEEEGVEYFYIPCCDEDEADEE